VLDLGFEASIQLQWFECPDGTLRGMGERAGNRVAIMSLNKKLLESSKNTNGKI